MKRNARIQGRLFFLLLAFMSGVSPKTAQAGEDAWAIFPSVDKGVIKDYTPVFEKHFKLDNGVLCATAGLGGEFYKKPEASSVMAGPGVIWVTNSAWPQDAENFEVVFDYKWFQDEPMKNYGDFPDMHAGFRINKDGEGYDLSWGMLGQIRLTRKGRTGSRLTAQGTLTGLKGKWARVKFRAAGPILKVKVWDAGKSEPECWSAEAFDDWSSSSEATFKRGAIALGFYARKLFDTCVYEFKDVKFAPLSPAEVSAERFFDEKTAPAYRGFASNADTILVKTAPPAVLFKDAQASAGATADKNLKIETGAEGLSLSSSDGEPAYLWIKVDPKFRSLAMRAKSEAGARPLFVVKAKTAGGEELASMDPVWRDGIAALLWKDRGHTASAYRWTWKPEAWHDFIVENGHWQKWQIVEANEEKNRAAFSARLIPAGTEAYFGIGVAGKGAVTVQGMSSK